MKPITIGQSITDRKDASLKIYLRDVSKRQLISAEKEIELARRIKQGDKQALNELIEANLRFAISIAKQYQHKGLDLVDLIQEASLGLRSAALNFDETKGFKFISYAVWWIRQSIMKALSNQCRTVRVPINQICNNGKLNKVIERLEQEYEREPSLEEIEERADVSNLKLAISANNRSVSLDSPIRDDESGCLLDIIPNDSDCEEEAESHSNKKVLLEILDSLPYRNRDIIKMSFGIGMDVMQHEEIANRFGIGSERVRQIKEASLDQLYHNYKDELRELL